MFVTLGSCAGPAINSMAINSIDSSRDTGKLFGGIAVVTALGSTMFGPLLFTLVYANTVGTYAPAIFGVAGGLLVIALVLTMFIRLPEKPQMEVAADHEG